jgi:hypothetical protein
MATMFPRELDPDDVKSDAELEMFRALETQLPDEWLAFHSVSWMVRDPAEGALDGEIDFVLTHPESAIVCLEVKGGKIACDHGQWKRFTKGRWERAKDPFQQALDHRYALSRMIDGVKGWRGKDLLIVHALAFPDTTVQAAMAPDGPREILVDANDMRELSPALERVLAYHRGAREKRRAPGEAGVEMLRELIARDVELRTPLSQRFREEQDELVRLTSQQAALLSRNRKTRRLRVTGCAGSGKTMLALEQARRWRHEERRVLFVCFNRRLQRHLRQLEADKGLGLWTFHALCVHLARRAKVSLPEYPKGESTPQEYFDEVLPNALIDAADELGPQFDALVVDEAQDLETHWLTALMSTLTDEARDPVWLFMDDNQNIYGQSQLELPTEFAEFELTWNCRNTQAIHREVAKLYRGEVEPEAIGPEGRAPELHVVADPVACLAGVLERLIAEEGVRQQDIVILSSHALAKSDFASGRLGPYTLHDDPARQPGILFSSIRGFKGLESPVVILCELEDLDGETEQQQLYVGMSRARNHCVIVVPQPPAG